MEKPVADDPPGIPAEAPDVQLHRAMTWRYIFIELAIVTAGLFIALMLNSAVEWGHHKQLVHDARRNIHREIAGNRRKVQEDLAYLRSSLAGVNANIATLQQMRLHRFTHGSLNNRMDYDTLDVAAWQTARDTGALAYMPYDEAQRYSGLYSTIDYLNNRATAVADAQFSALAPAEMGYDVGQLPPEQIVTMLRANADAKVGLLTLMQLLAEVDTELAKESRG